MISYLAEDVFCRLNSREASLLKSGPKAAGELNRRGYVYGKYSGDR